jgi:predicted DsbA family dithiol-disulfide isomerase
LLHVIRELHVDVYFDLICPWCMIGKSHLRRALDRLTDSDPTIDVRVLWHSVQLVPGVPERGWPFSDFYERRLGGRAAAQARQAQVNVAAAQAGTTIDFSRIATFPNTAAAHRLLALGARYLDRQAQDRLLDRLFAAYFQRGEDLGDAGTLAAIGAEQGLDPDAIRIALAQRGPLPNAPGVPGVPYFVFAGGAALSGAQPADVLLAAMQRVIRHRESPDARHQRIGAR